MNTTASRSARIYDHTHSLDVWVDDLRFRTAAPGAFESASFRLTDADCEFLMTTFGRVQIADVCGSEIAWEGRVESVTRAAEDEFAWQVSAIGTAVAAADAQPPVLYVEVTTL